MEEAIDLRPYIKILARRWYWIIGAAVLAGVVAFVVSTFLAPTYKATALVAITEPRLQLQFDPRIEELAKETQPLLAFPELATSDELLGELLDAIYPRLNDVTTLEELRERVVAQSGIDPSLVRLIASYRDPDDTAYLANTWADLFENRANAIFGDQSEDQERFFEVQLAETEVELSAAEEALVDFQALNRSSIISNELESFRQSQANYLADQRQIAFLLQDIKGLRDQLDGGMNGPVAFSDQLTALSLQLKAFNASAAIPLQLQMDMAESLTNRNRDQQVTYLSGLITTLETRSELANEILVELEPQILTLQEQKQEISTESARLNRDRDVAHETYITLARKVEEERISSEEISSVARVASEAAVPQEAVSPRKLLNAAVAGFLALIVALVAILAFGWWRQEERFSESHEIGSTEEN